MLPSITWQWSLISFDHEIHCRVTRLTQLQLRIVDDSCDFLVVVGAYFWAMITHLISRNSFSRASLTVCVCMCVCVREKLAVRWPGGYQSALLSAAAALGQLLSPFFAMQLTPLTPAPPTAQVFCPIAWQMAGRWLPPRSQSESHSQSQCQSQSEFVVCNFDFDSDSDSWPGPGLAGAI